MSAYVRLTCVDPGFFSGVGVKARRPENSMHNVFFQSSTYLTVYRGGGGGPMVLLQIKLYFSKDPDRSKPLPPPPPLDLHMSNLLDLMYAQNIKHCLVYFCVAFSRVLIIMTQDESCDIRQLYVV